MSVIIISDRPISSITDDKEKDPSEMSPNDLASYKIATYQEDASRKCLLPANSDARGGNWDVSRPKGAPNPEYVYATTDRSCVILVCDKGCREIANSQPLSMVFTIPTRCLYITVFSN